MRGLESAGKDLPEGRSGKKEEKKRGTHLEGFGVRGEALVRAGDGEVAEREVVLGEGGEEAVGGGAGLNTIRIFSRIFIIRRILE